jgi:hypothetical protein
MDLPHIPHKSYSIRHNSGAQLTRREVNELFKSKSFTLSAIKDKPTCRRCGSTENLLLNGFCFDCDEELEKQVK